MLPRSDHFQKQVVVDNLYRHVKYLSVNIGDRHLWKNFSLEKAADYIESAFGDCGYGVQRQTYSCYGKTVSNLIVEKTGLEGGSVIIGAHYDTVPGTPGADDNASALAGLLELASLMKENKNKKTLVFAAFVNEEPPCFGSNNMGSMAYAKDLKERGVSVEVMVSLEMIGYFSREPIQTYPLPGMGLFYPKTGDFIGVVGNFRSSKYVSLFKKGIKRHSGIDTRSLTAPEFFGGINLSDNYSFWRHGYRAIMITDTSFFRNRNYHQETDTIETLDFEQMAELVKGLYYTLSAF
ncbi:MAG TPA: M20/M25/M40 family metallo-hydrolase [Thermodesulfobacteriota bacterium]|jgi:Zn-dependent M28 family amino/carboxypeptidase|nr:M20/M25/M40 family metallo-hydrolase [Thermodesulfobacteriota bacterium]